MTDGEVDRLRRFIEDVEAACKLLSDAVARHHGEKRAAQQHLKAA